MELYLFWKKYIFLHDENFAQKNQQQKIRDFFNDLVRVLSIPYQTGFGKELTKPLPNRRKKSRKMLVDFFEQNFHHEEKIIVFQKIYNPT